MGGMRLVLKEAEYCPIIGEILVKDPCLRIQPDHPVKLVGVEKFTDKLSGRKHPHYAGRLYGTSRQYILKVVDIR